jgi:hypothetical protein
MFPCDAQPLIQLQGQNQGLSLKTAPPCEVLLLLLLPPLLQPAHARTCRMATGARADAQQIITASTMLLLLLLTGQSHLRSCLNDCWCADEHSPELAFSAKLLQGVVCWQLRLKAVDLSTKEVARHTYVQTT